MIIAKYKFNPDTYADLLPAFNSGGDYTYTKSDVTNSDGTITRTIESDTLPSYVVFGNQGGGGATDKTKALLEVISLDLSNVSNCYLLFHSCTNLKSALGIKLTSKTTNMASMFNGCSSLTSLDVINWNTSKVTNISYMFQGCKALTSLDLSNWNTSKVTNMVNMFNGCKALTSLDLSNWDTSKVTDISYMLMNCSSLTSLDVINWNTSKVTTMVGMFQNCISLTSLDLSNWDTSRVTNMSYMFNGCSSLTTLDISNLNTSNVTNMNNMFNGCSSLTSLDVINWDTNKVTNMGYMFYNCSSLTSLDLSNWDTSKVTTMAAMFSSLTSLTSLDVSNFNTSKVTDMSYVFYNSRNLTTLDISNWDMSQVTNTFSMFNNTQSLYKINLKYADEYTVSKVVIEFPNRTNTTPGYVLSSVDLTSDKNWQIIKSSHNNFYLPQPLNKIGDIKDRLYWDEDKGHYCIEQNIKSLTYKYESSHDIVEHSINDYNYIIHIKLPIDNDYSVRDGANWMYDIYSICDKAHSTPIGSPSIDKKQPIVSAYLTTIWSNRNGIIFTIPKDKLTSLTVDGAREFLSNFGEFTIYYVLHDDYVKIIDLPHLNQKFTFDSYNPSTSIDIPNRPLKASKTYLDAPIARYRYTGLQPSTQYNVQFDCKGDAAIKVNLGGTEVTFTPTSEWTRKNLTITTPSELVNDKLSISNVGITSNNKIDNVMLFSEVIAQEPDYIDGIQNIGELQDDGTYKIDILTHNGQGKNCFSYDLLDKSTVSANSGWTIFDLGLSTVGTFTLTVKNNSGHGGFRINMAGSPSEISNSPISTEVHSGYQGTTTGSINGKLCLGVYWNTGIFVGNGMGKAELLSVIKEGKIEIIIDSDDTRLDYSYESQSTHPIYLPQPLRKIGDVKDRLYWDEDKGHYCIEQNFGYTQFDGTESWGNNGTNYNLKITGKMKNSSCKIMTSCDLKFFSLNNDYIYLPSSAFGEGLNQTSKLKKYLSDNKPYLYYQLEYSNIIDLPYLNKKYSLDTYMPTTYLECPNSPMEPYSLLLKDDTVRYKTTIEPSTLYTIQFNCISKLTTNLTLDLGGTRKTVDPIIGVNHVQITTPSELTSDRLFLIGTGIIINEVIVNKGDMNQYTKYFDGEQGVGELQEDGSYIIRISTDNYTGLWEGDL